MLFRSAADALVATISEVHETNHNLSEAEKELLRWHYRLGHIGFKKIQFLGGFCGADVHCFE